MRYTLLFLFVFSGLQLVLASLWPTYPTADTILSAGEQAHLTWIDTQRRPRLADMGLLTIDLCTRDDRYIMTLATSVSPMLRNCTVSIPGNLTLVGPYVIIFISIYPIMRFWTADFDIITPPNVITDSALPYVPQLDGANATHPLLTLVLPSATITSDLPPTVEFAAATTISAGPLPKGGGAGTGLDRVHSPNSANPRKGSDYPDARFRLVFILWPALIGISMAL
ncbi:hypothetical protein C8R44DRAFT_811691 [Mycena epipterygia]|nr:hypothetical protein C8R44DRAFT_811691 [Mycena epipterygia]